MRLRVCCLENRDIYRNLAFEEAFFRSVPAQEIRLLFWVNDDCVVIGRNQDPAAECRQDVMEAAGVRLARRKTGGGAVFQDAGNLNYSFLFGAGTLESSGADPVRIIVAALDACGIRCSFTGRNDICEQETGRKVSGTAYMQSGERLLWHGTLLIGADLERMEACLKVPEEKLDRHFVRSVRVRVANLRGFRPYLTTEFLRDLLRKEIVRAASAAIGAKAEEAEETPLLSVCGIPEETVCGLQTAYASSAWILRADTKLFKIPSI